MTLAAGPPEAIVPAGSLPEQPGAEGCDAVGRGGRGDGRQVLWAGHCHRKGMRVSSSAPQLRVKQSVVLI